MVKVDTKDRTVQWCKVMFVEFVMTPQKLQTELDEFLNQGRLEQEPFEDYSARLDRLTTIYKIRNHALHQSVPDRLRKMLSPTTDAIMPIFHCLELDVADRPRKPAITDVGIFYLMLAMVPGPGDCDEWQWCTEGRETFFFNALSIGFFG
ncbi:hypothetical protein BGX30_010374 [Mortierella sp. GBA39]|nr:hypothetical protein BGX30_010374 [Mortierella sp. GBA39]